MLTQLSILLALLSGYQGERLLMFVPWNTRSHRMQQNAILEGMLARGHRVTGVFPQKYQEQHQNYTEIIVEDRYKGPNIFSDIFPFPSVQFWQAQ